MSPARTRRLALLLGVLLLGSALFLLRAPSQALGLLGALQGPALFGIPLRMPPTLLPALALILAGSILVAMGGADSAEPATAEPLPRSLQMSPGTWVWITAALLTVAILAVAESRGGVSRTNALALGHALVLAWGAVHLWRLDRRQGIPLGWSLTARDWLFLLACLGVSLYFQLHDVRSWKYAVIGDEFAYFDLARTLARAPWTHWPFLEASGPDGDHPMMVSIIQAVFLRVFGTSTVSWRASCAVLMAVAAPLLFVYVRSRFGVYAARGACVIYGFSALITCWAKIGKTCAFMLPAVVATLGLYQLSRRGSAFYAFLAAAAAGGGFFLHILGGVTATAVLVIGVLLDLLEPERRRSTLRRLGLIALGWALAASPILVQADYLRGLLEKNVAATWITSTTVLQNSIHAALAFLYFENGSHFLFGNVSDVVSALLILVGLAHAARRRKGEAFLLLALCVLMSGTIAKYPYPPPTRLPLVALPWAVFGGAGAGLLIASIPWPRFRPFVFVGIAAAVVALNHRQWAREDDRVLNENQSAVRLLQGLDRPTPFVYVVPAVWNNDLDNTVFETLGLPGKACHDWECPALIQYALASTRDAPLLLLLHPLARLPAESKDWLLAARVEAHVVRAGLVAKLADRSAPLSVEALQTWFANPAASSASTVPSVPSSARPSDAGAPSCPYVRGFGQLVAASNRGPYPDYRGGSEGYWEYCQRSGEAVAWLTAPNPCRGVVQFVFAGSTSETPGRAELSINRVRSLVFDTGTTADGVTWSSGDVTLRYVHKAMALGFSGYYVLSVPESIAPLAAPAALSVTCSQGEETTWFMVKDLPDTIVAEGLR